MSDPSPDHIPLSPGVSMSIGELAAQTGCKVETIRYYEKTGLIPSPPRTAGGHRVYAQKHLKRLKFVRRGRELGFSMKQIRGLLETMEADSLSCGEVARRVEDHLNAVRGRVEALRRLESILSITLEQCDRGEQPACPIIDALQGETVNLARLV